VHGKLTLFLCVRWSRLRWWPRSTGGIQGRSYAMLWRISSSTRLLLGAGVLALSKGNLSQKFSIFMCQSGSVATFNHSHRFFLFFFLHLNEYFIQISCFFFLFLLFFFFFFFGIIQLYHD
jgi:hypothetical protein